MKQYITLEQINELSEKGFERLRHYPELFSSTNKYILRDKIHFPLLSIGQMIELLSGNGVDWLIYLLYSTPYKGTLCDCLWEKVKEVLENEKI